MLTWIKQYGVWRQVDKQTDMHLVNREAAVKKANSLRQGSREAANLRLLAIQSALKAGLAPEFALKEEL